MRKNQLVSKTNNDNTITYTYDANGNEIKVQENGETITENTYNARNELIKTVDNGVTITYEYDILGNRIERTSGEDTTKYFYEGNNVVLELNADDEQIAKNVYGINLISRIEGENIGFYLYNGHGDIVQILDSNENILNSYSYDDFGNIETEEEKMDNPFKYAGYYYDDETQNYYLLSRYYDPAIARFTSEDTYRGEIEDPLSLNQYVYARSNPLRYVDEDGHLPIPIITAFIGAIFNTGVEFVGDLLDDGQINNGWRSYAGAAVEGAIIGGGLAILPTGTGTITKFVANVGIGSLASSTDQLISTGNVNIETSIKEGITLGTSMWAFGIGGNAGKLTSKTLGVYMAKGSLASTVGNVTYQTLDKGIENIDVGEVVQSAVIGAIVTPPLVGIYDYSIEKFGPTQEIYQAKNVKIDEGLNSYNKYKRVYGKAQKGKELHHIVEQIQIKKTGFDPKLIQNPKNIIEIDKSVHQRITAHYNSKILEYNMTVREWLSGQSFEVQYNYGLDVLKRYGGIR